MPEVISIWWKRREEWWFRMAAVVVLWSAAVSCHQKSPVPPIPAPVPNIGDPDLNTVQLSVSNPERSPTLIRETRDTGFNVAWLGHHQPRPPAEPIPYLVKIGKKRRDGIFVQLQSHLVLQSIGNEGDLARYRAAVIAPKEAGNYWLRLQTPDEVILDIQLVVE